MALPASRSTDLTTGAAEAVPVEILWINVTETGS